MQIVNKNKQASSNVKYGFKLKSLKIEFAKYFFSSGAEKMHPT